MRYRSLGTTGLSVSEITFGAWGIGRGFWKGGDDAESARALDAAADQGVNFFDTAPGYGRGHSERLIGSLFRRQGARLHVATKIPPLNQRWPASGTVSEAFPREHIEASVALSRKNLGVDTIDLVQLHVWHPDWISDLEWSDTLDDLRERGWLAHYGVSCSDHEPDSVVALVEQGRVATVQVIYNIFDQSPAIRMFPICVEQGVGVLVRVPLDEGGLAGTLRPDSRFPKGDWRNHYFTPARLAELADRLERLEALLGDEVETLPELALRFSLEPAAVSTVLVGMRRQDHVRHNTAASGMEQLSKPLMNALREQGWARNFYLKS